MKVLIVEDNFYHAQKLKRVIEKNLDKACVFINFFEQKTLILEQVIEFIKTNIFDLDVIIADINLNTSYKNIENGIEVLEFAKSLNPLCTKMLICGGHTEGWLGLEKFDGVFQAPEGVSKLIKYLQNQEKGR